MATFQERGYDTSWLKDTFHLGVDLTLDDGSPYPDVIFDQQITQAARAVGDELGLILEPQSFLERHDKEPESVGSWYPLRTRFRPLLDVDSVHLVYGQSSTKAEIPKEWAQITEHLAGQIHIIPTTTGSTAYMISGELHIVIGTLSTNYYIPAYIELGYQAGFPVYSGQISFEIGEQSKNVTLPKTFHDIYEVQVAGATVTNKGHSSITIGLDNPALVQTVINWKIDTLPSDIARAIGLKSGLLALDVAGDLIAGAGVAQLSTSMDGLSQSLQTSSSPTNSGYGARVLQFTKEYKELIGTLRGTYRSINIAAL